MSKKRRDSKNRVLRSGESQRKDGRYAYKYIDTFGNPQFVYAWKLVPTDKTPAGKREDISLREKVKEIQKDLDDGIDTIGKKMTVCQLYAKQIRHRGNVRYNTKNGRKRLMKLLEEDKLGGCPIDSVKLSDAKEWAIRMKEKVKEIQKDLDDGIDTIGKKMTVCQLYAKQIRHRGNVRYNTKNGRKRLMKLLEEDKLGGCPIDSVKLSDAKEWAIRMKEKGISYKTISNDKRSLKAAFYTAIQDDCIRKNPFDFQLNTVIEDDTEPKFPLTPAQEESFLSFAQNDKVYQKYYDELIILLGTGLRISELCGLTDTDINFENRIINVDHQLLRSAETGYYIETPKTKSGIRQIPMSEKVYEAFNRVLKRRRGAKAVTIDGYSNFLFLNRDGYPKTATNYDGMFRGLAKKYNKYHEEALPKVMTPHTLRHTFCTNMANAGMNPKALQYIMGHSNITMTLNYYAHATFDSAKAEMLRIAA